MNNFQQIYNKNLVNWSYTLGVMAHPPVQWILPDIYILYIPLFHVYKLISLYKVKYQYHYSMIIHQFIILEFENRVRFDYKRNL